MTLPLASLLRLAPLALTLPASAQLVVTGASNPSAPDTHEVRLVDVVTGSSVELFPGWVPPTGDPAMASAAADEAAGLLYLSSNPNAFTSDGIYVWPYGSPGNPIPFVLDPLGPNGVLLDVQGLAVANGVVHFTSHYVGNDNGLYALSPGTGLATRLIALPITSFQVNGLTYNPADGLFYGTNDSGSSRGVWSFDTSSGDVTFVSPYPAGIQDVDGCVLEPTGAGILHLIRDTPGPIDSLDLATLTYSQTLTNPLSTQYLFAGGAWAAGLAANLPVGASYCGPAVPNSTGAAGEIELRGSSFVLVNELRVEASSLPVSSLAIALTSRTQDSVPMPGGSVGTLCLGGAIGRYVGPGQPMMTDAAGRFELQLDLTRTPQPTGLVAVAPGESWSFQCWHRDSVGGQATSNFTDGVEITFR
ncbi:MAG: hypothetical protein AAF957_19700 [Planctomycetota bacterium]